MRIRTNRTVIALRNAGRTIGVNRLLSRMLTPRGYEDRFQNAMFDALQVGDCVWDVGANVGLYTANFAERVGLSGKVCAFEPSPENLGRLRAAMSHVDNVVVLPVALGDRKGKVAFQQGDDDLGATSRVVDNETAPHRKTISVAVTTGDLLVAAGAAPRPNLVKIDTEGYELDVLRGMQDCLSDSALRVLCIEVHFGLLASRGMKDGPAAIEQMLITTGFHCMWPDASHIVASRS